MFDRDRQAEQQEAAMSTMTVSTALGRSGFGVGVPATRLTRRGRLLLTGVALVLLVVAAVLLSGGAPASAGTDQAPAATGERVTVRPGETLWQIAERVAPGSDPRETVARILDLNGLQTAEVQAGSALRLP
jgi:hypothetical protein